MKTMYSLEEATKVIDSGRNLVIAAEEKLLDRLPKGCWIAGTIPYMMTEEGGVTTDSKLQIQILPDDCDLNSIRLYTADQLEGIPADYPADGLSMIVLPGLSEPHLRFGKNVPFYKNIFDRPLVGWVSGIHLDNLGKMTPKVYNGQTGEKTDAHAVVMHLDLPKDKFAKVDVINLFVQGDGDTIVFDQAGFTVKNCLVNGQERVLAEYLGEIKVDVKLPLVADYSGVGINVSIQNIDQDKKEVSFYNAVQEGVEYKLARPIDGDYSTEFQKKMDPNSKPFFSCNCVLNYLYAELEGKKTGNNIGPMTFGEVAYMLLNQTMVYVTIHSK